MTPSIPEQREIYGISKTVRDLLKGMKYSIDYYQREYKWQAKQVEELLDDLTNCFLEDHDDANPRGAVAGYRHYFLGSIIVSSKGSQKFLIDGQQRLTTLTLLLIYLHNLQRDRGDRVDISDMILSTRYGKKSFNLEVSERQAVMDALFTSVEFDPHGQPESVRNIYACYRDIEAHFPEDIKDETLPYFIDWLIENVHLVEITAYNDEDAYTIFETMNDRGLSLSPTDMLKGYLLANITDESNRTAAAQTWKQIQQDLTEAGADEMADFFKAWLRSQYAESIRERKKHAKPQDFDHLGTEFHRWVRDHRGVMGLNKSDDFYRFIEYNLRFYARWYQRLRRAAQEYTPGLEDLFHIAQLGFTLQYPVLLAAIQPQDDERLALKKIRIVAAFIENLLARRVWNWHSISYSTMQYAMFLAMKQVRGKSPQELAANLADRLGEEENFSANERFGMHKMNRYTIHRLLARMTAFLERESGLPSRYTEYIGNGKVRYEVEHIWADHFERHQDEFNHPADFDDYRNRIGGLLLLPKSFNASYGDLPYEEKREHYLKQNLLAQSLHPKCYERNPGFLKFIERSGLPFKPYEHFKKADLDERQRLYTQLAEQTWSIERLSAIAREGG
ncbi:MAG TPA: DUF262 domain-containing protein [Anaerolineae bacterium]|nr:DUF262 domain-containing protein [Anaerolineae bacterium]